MAMQRQNDQKVASYVRAKAQHSWDKLVIVAKQCPPLPKPNFIKLTLEQLLQVSSLNAQGMGNVPQDVVSRMEKNKDLQEMIQSTCSAYAQ